MKYCAICHITINLLQVIRYQTFGRGSDFRKYIISKQVLSTLDSVCVNHSEKHVDYFVRVTVDRELIDTRSKYKFYVLYWQEIKSTVLQFEAIKSNEMLTGEY